VPTLSAAKVIPHCPKLGSLLRAGQISKGHSNVEVIRHFCLPAIKAIARPRSQVTSRVLTDTNRPAVGRRRVVCILPDLPREFLELSDTALLIDVMDEDSRSSEGTRAPRPAGDHVEVVVVVAGDGQVPHPSVVLLRDGAADHGDGSAVWGLELVAYFEVFCRNPAVVQVWVPEQVVAGGVDDLGAGAGLDGEVVEVGVVVDQVRR